MRTLGQRAQLWDDLQGGNERPGSSPVPWCPGLPDLSSVDAHNLSLACCGGLAGRCFLGGGSLLALWRCSSAENGPHSSVETLNTSRGSLRKGGGSHALLSGIWGRGGRPGRGLTVSLCSLPSHPPSGRRHRLRLPPGDPAVRHLLLRPQDAAEDLAVWEAKHLLGPAPGAGGGSQRGGVGEWSRGKAPHPALVRGGCPWPPGCSGGAGHPPGWEFELGQARKGSRGPLLAQAMQSFWGGGLPLGPVNGTYPA